MLVVDGRFALDADRPQSIGKVRTFYGNFGVLVRAYTYIRMLGADGLRRVAETAVTAVRDYIKNTYGADYLPKEPFVPSTVNEILSRQADIFAGE